MNRRIKIAFLFFAPLYLVFMLYVDVRIYDSIRDGMKYSLVKKIIIKISDNSNRESVTICSEYSVLQLIRDIIIIPTSFDLKGNNIYNYKLCIVGDAYSFEKIKKVKLYLSDIRNSIEADSDDEIKFLFKTLNYDRDWLKKNNIVNLYISDDCHVKCYKPTDKLVQLEIN